jgi:predicted metalloprotease
MARRRSSGGYDDGGGHHPHARRRSGGQDGLLIALAIAGVLGVVMFFVISSGSSGDEEKYEAREALTALFKAAVANDERAGRELVDPRRIMAELQKKKMKEWHELTPEEKSEYAAQTFRLIRGRILMDLGFAEEPKPDVAEYLQSATVQFVPSRGEVEFTWTHLGTPWRAMLDKDDLGRWIVFDFAQTR